MSEQQKLREAVARAMFAIPLDEHIDEDFAPVSWEEATDEARNVYLREADAAIAVALEQAARVAEGNGLRQYTGKPLIDEIAAALRALIPSESETGEIDER